jgi:response regulator RpfG family c-di-GMP phosphodiesterase
MKNLAGGDVGEGRQVAKSPIAAGAGTFTVLATNVKALAQRLRQQHPNRADVPVIAASFLDDKNFGFANGAADYLTKLIHRKRLLISC